MRTRPLMLLAAVFLFLGVTAVAHAQIATAIVEGIVTDPSGAVLPGVDVEIRNADTNLTRALVTDRDGRFVAPQLPSGRYIVVGGKLDPVHVARLSRHQSLGDGDCTPGMLQSFFDLTR